MLSVIIPTYNEEKNIEACLKALQAQTLPRGEFEVIVVDGGSKDRTVELATPFADKVFQQHSKGVGGARNDGFEVARGDIIVTTDGDCQPDPRWLESVKESFSDPKVVAATGPLVPMTGHMGFLEAAVYRLLFWKTNVFFGLGQHLGVFHLCGANSAFRKETFYKVGGYRDLAYADDVEIIKRLKPAGRVVMNGGMKLGFNVRRIQKMGLVKYTYTILKYDFLILFMGRNITKGNWAKTTY